MIAENQASIRFTAVPRSSSVILQGLIIGLTLCFQQVWAESKSQALPPLPPAPIWEPVRLNITRDTWLSSADGEQDFNLGGAERLKFKGIQEFSLIDVDPREIHGRVIKAASLHLLRRSESILKRMTVSTVTSPWVEGTSQRYVIQKGSASFRWAAQGVEYWAGLGSDVTSVANGAGNSLWAFADAVGPGHDGWQTIPVDPRVVAARVAGISHGFLVFDDVGSEYEHKGDHFKHVLFPNRFTYSREARYKYAPYMTVYLGQPDDDAPDSVGQISSSNDQPWLKPGEAIVSWTTPADSGLAGVAGFHVYIGGRKSEIGNDASIAVPTYMVPAAGAVGQAVTMHLRGLDLEPGAIVSVRIRAVDGAGNRGPLSIGLVQLAPEWPEIPLPSNSPDSLEMTEKSDDIIQQEPSVFVVDLLDKIDPESGQMIPAQEAGYRRLNHLWSAQERRVRLFGSKNEFVSFQLVVANDQPGTKIKIDFEPDLQSDTTETESGESGKQDTASLISTVWKSGYVKSGHKLLPDPLIPLENIETAVGFDDEASNYQSYLVDIYVPHQADEGVHRGTICVTKGDQTTELAVDLQVWRFTLPDFLSFIPQMNCYGLPSPPQELGFYRLAHEHRTALNRLPYNWRGEVRDGISPQWSDDHVDWDAFDQRFGPLLDGSAFEDLPRRGVPVDVFYLPLNENWPMNIHEAFTDSYWAEQALPPEYWQQLADASRIFAEHFDQKRWFNTFFEFYLNNKIFFKQSQWRNGSAPWIFDEPVNTQDFWALRQFGRSFHQGIAGARGRAKMVFRCDISRPQWQRDLLDGVMDINVVSGAFGRYPNRVIDRKIAHDQIVYEYGSATPIAKSNVQPAGWCIDAWARGADGVLPWQTVGTNRSWVEADSQALIYPGEAIGHHDGPLPSVRLKAFRRGQQDVEYLTLMSQVLNLSRGAIGARITNLLNLKGDFTTEGYNDAGTISYKNLKPKDLWSIRTRVGAILDEIAPPLKRRLVHLRTPNRDPSTMTDQKYFAPQPAAVRAKMLLNVDTNTTAQAPEQSDHN